MAAPTKQRFHEISTFKYGATDEYNTIKSVDADENTDVLADSGDNDTTDTFLEKGKTSCSWSMVISDPIQAAAIKAHAKGDITFIGTAATGGTNVTVTIAGAIALNKSNRQMHNGVWGYTITGRATSYAVAPVA